MGQTLQMESRAFGSGIALTLKGDLDRAAEQVLKSAFDWEEGLGGRRRYLVLDLHQVAYINSAGMALLIRIARAGRKQGYHTFACGVSTHYQKLFRMVGLTEYLMLYPDEYAVFQRIEALEGEG
ncbi:MAG TPA: STAS domain-containing protein [Paenibacillus sp.]|uniref:STAS domain-containing protein n=1 Tax=Paenibacillus sp. TaxID=58172 RepID=UPI0028D31584|nr:STAS domain-containing protein [Paenibacillus sp.]HUC92716.1 STAS domain-containing protein [Paenibacillus sp.]